MNPFVEISNIAITSSDTYILPKTRIRVSCRSFSQEYCELFSAAHSRTTFATNAWAVASTNTHLSEVLSATYGSSTAWRTQHHTYARMI